MGGCTISAIRATREEAMEDVKAKLIEAASKGLWPDSELVILQKGRGGPEIYQALFQVEELGPDPKGVSVSLAKVETGRAFHVELVARLARAMKPGEWIATIHVHT